MVIAFFGDGASNQGVFHESLNLAAVWKLPIIFVCENNQYALSTSSKRTVAGESIAGRAAGYGMPGVRVDGNDVGAVYDAVKTAVTRARAGEGPTLVEAMTYRWGEHSMRANLPDYRTKDEEREWMERDPIARFEPAAGARRRHADAAQGARGSGGDRAGSRGRLRQGERRADRRRDGVRGLRAARAGHRAHGPQRAASAPWPRR